VIACSITGGDGIGWAIDEDRRLIRAALDGLAREVPVPFSQVVHAPFWMGLDAHPPAVLRRRFVIAHADNPPFFYLTQPEFARAQQLVDLWVARSTEAAAQFDALRLRHVLIPYAIDPALFFPIAEKAALRHGLGLPENTYVIGNFHRDSEGADLSQPKLQKAPELFVMVCRRLVAAGACIHVLLAGPRRHWMRGELARAGIPFTFAGDASIAGDDLRQNILPRERLNELYNACDLILLPARWEGGPQAVMEAAAARVKILSTPTGVARDILEPASLFETAEEAVRAVLMDIGDNALAATVAPQHGRWKARHTNATMNAGLRDLYASIQTEDFRPRTPWRDMALEIARITTRRHPRRQPRRIGLLHQTGSCPCLDRAIPALRTILEGAGIECLPVPLDCTIAGSVRDPLPPVRRLLQITGPGFNACDSLPKACMVVPSAQDAVNHRSAGGANPVVVCPLVFEAPPGPTEPLVVEENDREASVRILEAMLAGNPVVYPEGTSFGVFHGGISYGSRRARTDAIAAATAHSRDFRSLARVPGPSHAKRFFLTLLAK
jgi:glycosyltransferase involved in cell wall biosynthesis